MENFLHRLSVEYLPISFVHLKYLKKDVGSKNYGKEYNALANKVLQSKIVTLESYPKYTEMLKMHDLLREEDY